MNLKRFKWWGKEPEFHVITPRYGEKHIPPSVWRKYDQIEIAMDNNNRLRVHELQVSLIKGGFEAPAKISDLEGIKKRLNEQQRHFEKGLK